MLRKSSDSMKKCTIAKRVRKSVLNVKKVCLMLTKCA